MSSHSDGSTSPGSYRKPSSRAPRVFNVASTDSISPLLTPLGPTHISNLRLQTQSQRRSGTHSRPFTTGSMTSSRSPSPDASEAHLDDAEDTDNSSRHGYQDLYGHLVKQIINWLHEEKGKHPGLSATKIAESLTAPHAWNTELHASPTSIPVDSAKRHSSELALERLERILSESKARAANLSRRVSISHRPFMHKKRSTGGKRSRRVSLGAPSSDNEYADGDIVIPSVDAVLDNSKTLGYAGGGATENVGLTRTISSRSIKEDNWTSFKNEIIKLAHTLRLKGWRLVDLNSGADISVRRLSGALTNAVYVVTPPKHVLENPPETDSTPTTGLIRRPRKLLLRIYGPQAEHLIDREAELETLRRLARRNIGPRLLGTFMNGRFEEFLNAQTLTPDDLRKPETYKQIAKRMRELHSGVDLLEHERARGPFVWQNWDKWVSRCEEVITWLDEQISLHHGSATSEAEIWKTRGFVCGVRWARFRKAVDSYRRWLIRQYGGEDRMKARLVFAHNDTQYGNLLRMIPTGESPLLLPANEHKQLVVIDFEYANANLPGLEFANHFTEWCYNYHSPTHSYACNTALYPTPKEQQRFLSAYVQHTAPSSSPSSTEKLLHQSSVSSISSFMLDSRSPVNQYDAEEAARDEHRKAEVERLMKETRLWRVANSAQWVAWGIVQAKVAGMDEALEQIRQEKLQSGEIDSAASKPPSKDSRTAEAQVAEQNETISASDGMQSTSPQGEQLPHVPHEHEIDDEPEFDYLAYAQQRALFFWGDLLELGFIKEEDLPQDVLPHVKRVPY